MVTRRRKGTVHIEALDNGSCRLRYTFNRQRYAEAVKPEYAQLRKQRIELEIIEGTHIPLKLQQSVQNLTLIEAWGKFLEFKKKETKPKTFSGTYKPIDSWFQKCPYKHLSESEKAISWYSENCTEGMTKRILMRLSACCAAYCESNPYEGRYKKFKDKYQENPDPRMLTDEEIGAGLATMNERGANLVRFMLLTGCRPGEALGLHHEDLKKGFIHFHQQCLEAEGRVYLQEGLKTQKERYFPVNDELAGFLETLKGESLVFSDLKGGLMRLSNFRRRAWVKAFPEDTTPYNCRDTFITQQLIKGVSSEVIAAWVGNSAAVINKHYLDRVKLGLSQMPK